MILFKNTHLYILGFLILLCQCDFLKKEKYPEKQFSHNIIQNTLVGTDTYLVVFSKDEKGMESKYLISAIQLHEEVFYDELDLREGFIDTLNKILKKKGRFQLNEKALDFFDFLKIDEREYLKFKGVNPRLIFEKYYEDNYSKNETCTPKEGFNNQELKAAIAYLVLHKVIVYYDNHSRYTIINPPDTKSFGFPVNAEDLMNDG